MATGATGLVSAAQEELERVLIECALEQTGGQRQKAAELLDGPGGLALAELPKGWKVYVVEEGDLAKVVTLDGREGWVEAKRLK